MINRHRATGHTMQLDIFNDSRDVMLRNAVIDALSGRNPAAAALAARLQWPPLGALVQDFNAEFDGDAAGRDFAWFPAWASIVRPQLATRLHEAQAGADTAPERCARLVFSLLALEREGRHALLVDGRKKLRDAHAMLFERYMQSRR